MKDKKQHTDKHKHTEESINKIHSILIKASKDESFKKELKAHCKDIFKKRRNRFI